MIGSWVRIPNYLQLADAIIINIVVMGDVKNATFDNEFVGVCKNILRYLIIFTKLAPLTQQSLVTS